MEHLNTILDALGREINRLNGIIATRDWQLREANEQLGVARQELLDARADVAVLADGRAKDQIIMAQTAKLVGKLRDMIARGDVAAAPYVSDALDNILAVLADCAKEDN
mgnify:CR=1 FL=1